MEAERSRAKKEKTKTKPKALPPVPPPKPSVAQTREEADERNDHEEGETSAVYSNAGFNKTLMPTALAGIVRPQGKPFPKPHRPASEIPIPAGATSEKPKPVPRARTLRLNEEEAEEGSASPGEQRKAPVPEPRELPLPGLASRERVPPVGTDSPTEPLQERRLYPELDNVKGAHAHEEEEEDTSEEEESISKEDVKVALDVKEALLDDTPGQPAASTMQRYMVSPSVQQPPLPTSPEHPGTSYGPDPAVLEAVAAAAMVPGLGPPPMYSPPVPDRRRAAPAEAASPQQTQAAAAAEKPMLLAHKDFPPRQLKKGKDGTETFIDLVQRANDWLSENLDIQVSSLECIIWMSADKKKYFTDNAMVFKSMHAVHKKTKMARGLRIWYFKREEKFWSKAPGQVKHIGFRDYLLGKSSSIHAALYELNTDIKTKEIHGNLTKVETLHIPHDLPTITCMWNEKPDGHKDYDMFLRFFYITWNDAPPVKAELGIRDFVPRYDDRSPHSQGYEKYGDLFERAAKWMFRQSNNVRCVNIQSLYVKYKKDIKDTIDVWDRHHYREHDSSSKTEYLRIIRVITVRFPDGRAKAAEPYRLSYRTFAAAPLTDIQTMQPMEVSETCFEDLRHTVEKIGKWIYASGARIVSIETVPVRWATGGQHVDGSEATLCYNQKVVTKVALEQWVYYIRMYIDGEFDSSLPLPHTTY